MVNRVATVMRNQMLRLRVTELYQMEALLVERTDYPGVLAFPYEILILTIAVDTNVIGEVVVCKIYLV